MPRFACVAQVVLFSCATALAQAPVVPLEVGQVSNSPMPESQNVAPKETGFGKLETRPTAAAERSFSGPAQKPKEQKSFWETVPPVQPFPRQGNFSIAPTGRGEYTLFDHLRGIEREKRPKMLYLQWGQNANSSFNLDFRYLDDPKNKEFDFFDPFKRIHFGEDWLFSTGGEIRDRYATIQNPALYNRKPGAGSTDIFNLFRTRVYGDLWYRDEFRIFAEFLSAQSSAQTIPFAGSDVAKNDFPNLFAEVKLAELDGHGVYARVGRQELLFGSQRVLSPSDWSNTRRPFQGVRLSWHDDKIEEDVFLVNTVTIDPSKISSIDRNQIVAGNYFKYRFTKDQSADFYYVYYQNDNPVARGTGGQSSGFRVSTFGSRFIGEVNQFLYDFEGTIQAGSWANQTILAGMSSNGVGYYFKDFWATPSVWAYYDYASGDPNPQATGTHRTYSTLFPFGHSYFAGLDAIGRQNIHDLHFELGAFPAYWCRVQLGYHYLQLANVRDALYNPQGGVVRQDIAGKSGRNLGNAVSSTIQFHIDEHNVFFVGYSHLFAGDYIRNTAITPAAGRDISALWIQYIFKW